MKTIKTTKMIAMGLFTLCTMGLTNATFAGVKSKDPAELKFIGKFNDRPTFELNLNNAEAQEYYINIKDANSNVLYSEKVKGENLTRKYQLDIDEYEMDSPDFAVTVEVTSAKTHKTEVYKISTKTSVTKDIIVAQL